MGSSRRRFTKEYKGEAVALVVDSDRPIADVARELGINETTLGNWLKKSREDCVVAEKPLSVSERVELEELRRKYAEAQMDLSFLKKAAASFASQRK